MRVYLINVGANSSHGFASPVFEDGRFEFLPIPEGDPGLTESPLVVHYCDLRSHYDSNRDLRRYVPQDCWEAACHKDPEFETFTYGDVCVNPRAANLAAIENGDVLLFIARMRHWMNGKPSRGHGFALVGGLSVDAMVPDVRQPLSGSAAERFARNAHVIRARATGCWEGFWLFGGSSQSRRFARAIPVVREVCDRVFRDRLGKPWDWSRQTETGTIGSYTRTCRCVLDTSDPGGERRVRALREWIAQHSGVGDAALLDQ